MKDSELRKDDTMGHDCADCRDAERQEQAEALYIVRDPETGKLVKRAYLCVEHRAMYAEDGYEVKVA